jgi:hypothetical protein
MSDPEMMRWFAARRVELDELEKQLAGQMEQVRVERDELAVAERVQARMSEQIALQRAAASPDAARPRQVASAAILLVAHCGPGAGECVLLADYRRILALVRQEGGPAAVRQIGEHLGLPVRTLASSASTTTCRTR